MSAPALETSAAKPSVSGLPQASTGEIDFSCRKPVLFLLGASVVWLVISLLLGVLASVKSHAPGMLAGYASLTYGRVAAAASLSLLYGFASQAGMGIALWLLARLGRTLLVIPSGAVLAALLWNAALCAGILGVFGGEMSQHTAFEMPPRIAPVLFVAYSIIGISGLLTFHARTERQLFPSVWWLVAALFVFPWIFSTAILLLGESPTRGVLEPVVATWFANNFSSLWLGSIAIATVYYFSARLAGQPVHNYGVAVFAFWFYLLTANAGGFQNRAGLPNWMANLSMMANSVGLLAVLAILTNWYRSWVGHNRAKKDKEPAARFISFAIAAFLGSALLTAWASRPSVDQVVGLTYFTVGVANFYVYGFVAMAFLAGIYYILPRLTDVDWPKPGFISAHFALTLIGILLSTAALLLGGYVQGTAINNADLPFATVASRVVPFIGINTVALLALLVGQVLLLLNIASMLRAYCAENCGSGAREVAK